MSAFKTPFIDRNVRYSTERFESKDCIMQKYMALFLSKPELYSSVLTSTTKQYTFFNCFSKFIDKYIELNASASNEYKFDMEMYFTPLEKIEVSQLNITGGESRTAGAKKAMLSKYHSMAENRKTVIEYFNRKYGWNLAISDPRLFLGHSQPWLNPSPALLILQGWDTILANSAYDDETMSKPLPEDLDKDLVPLNIRNKVYTSWKNKINREIEKRTEIARKKQLEEEEAEENAINNTEPVVDKELEEKRLQFQKLAESASADWDEEDW